MAKDCANIVPVVDISIVEISIVVDISIEVRREAPPAIVRQEQPTLKNRRPHDVQAHR